MKLVKSLSALAIASSLAACGGGGGVTVEKADGIVKGAIDVKAYDANGDNFLSAKELQQGWKLLNPQLKEIVASYTGYDVATLDKYAAMTLTEDEQNVVDEIYAETLNAQLNVNNITVYEFNTIANIAAAQEISGITGKNVKILIKEVNPGSAHETHVTNIASMIATGATINVAKTYWDGKEKEYHVINASYGQSYGITASDTQAEAKAKIEAWNLEDVNDYTGLQLKDDTSLTELLEVRQESIDNEEAYGALYTYAAGNEAQTCKVLSDCSAAVIDAYSWGETIIVVGALNREGTKLAEYSNAAGLFKNEFLTAPVYHDKNGNDGTSYAAPVVAGVAALIMEKYDNTDAKATREILFKTADDLGAEGVDEIYGHGRLNVGAALSPVGQLN